MSLKESSSASPTQPLPLNLLVFPSASPPPSLSLSLSLSLWEIKYQCTSDFESPRNYFFLFGAKHGRGHFAGLFDGASPFLTPKLPLATLRTILESKMSRPPRETLRNASLYVLPTKKNISRTFKISSTLIVNISPFLQKHIAQSRLTT
jgi:hypothetical protein